MICIHNNSSVRSVGLFNCHSGVFERIQSGHWSDGLTGNEASQCDASSSGYAIIDMSLPGWNDLVTECDTHYAVMIKTVPGGCTGDISKRR